MIVYKSTNLLNNKVYIGITTRDFQKRKKEHIKSSYTVDNVFYRAMRKYGEINFSWEVIDTANDIDELKEKEVFWIKYYNSSIFSKESNGYNMTNGGDGVVGFRHLDGHNKGSKNNNTNLKESEIIEIKKILKEGKLTQKEIANKFNITNDVVSQIKKGKSWSYVGENVSDIQYWNSKKLNSEQIIEIKKLIKCGSSNREIADKFNISILTIRNIKKGVTWSAVGDDVSMIDNTKPKNQKLSEKEVREIKILLCDGKLKIREIASKYGVSNGSINGIKQGRTWNHILIS